MAVLQSSAGTGANDLSIDAPNSSTGGFATTIGKFKKENLLNNKRQRQDSREQEEEFKK